MEQIIHPKKIHIAVLILLFLAIGFAIYSNILHSPSVFDDDFTIDIPLIKSGQIFTQFNQPRYIGSVTFALNYKFYRGDRIGYHIVNVLIHIINALLVFVLMRMILLRLQSENQSAFYHLIPVFIAMIFLVHPIQTQAVTYIVQRYTSLAAMFVLLSLISYMKFRLSSPVRYHYYVLSLLAALLAYKTKENTATLPLMIFLIEYIIIKQPSFSLKKKIMIALPFILLLAVIPASFMKQDYQGSPDSGKFFHELNDQSYKSLTITQGQYLLTECRVIMTYIRLLLLPIHQSIDYYYPVSTSLFEIRTFLSLCFLVLLAGLSIMYINKYAFISFGVLWFIIFLLVESSLVPLADVIFEHRLYLPSIGFIAAIVYLLYLILTKFNLKWLAAVPLIIILILSIATYERNKVWKDEIILFKDAIAKYPQNLRNYLVLANAYTKKNQCEDAVNVLKKLIPFNYSHPKAHSILAFCYLQQGNLDESLREYDRALKINPYYYDAYPYIALAYLYKGDMNNALAILNKAYDHNKFDPLVNTALGSIYCEMKNLDKAFFFYNEAIKSDPAADTIYYNLGICMFKFGKFAESRTNFLKAIHYNPDSLESYYVVAATYELEHNFQEAAHYYQLFLSRAPKEHALINKVKAKLERMKQMNPR